MVAPRFGTYSQFLDFLGADQGEPGLGRTHVTCLVPRFGVTVAGEVQHRAGAPSLLKRRTSSKSSVQAASSLNTGSLTTASCQFALQFFFASTKQKKVIHNRCDCKAVYVLQGPPFPEIQSDARALAGMRALDSRPDRAVRTDMHTHTSLVMHTLVSFPFLCVNQATKQKLQQLAQAMLPC